MTNIEVLHNFLISSRDKLLRLVFSTPKLSKELRKLLCMFLVGEYILHIMSEADYKEVYRNLWLGIEGFRDKSDTQILSDFVSLYYEHYDSDDYLLKYLPQVMPDYTGFINQLHKELENLIGKEKKIMVEIDQVIEYIVSKEKELMALSDNKELKLSDTMRLNLSKIIVGEYKLFFQTGRATFDDYFDIFYYGVDSLMGREDYLLVSDFTSRFFEFYEAGPFFLKSLEYHVPEYEKIIEHFYKELKEIIGDR